MSSLNLRNILSAEEQKISDGFLSTIKVGSLPGQNFVVFTYLLSEASDDEHRGIINFLGVFATKQEAFEYRNKIFSKTGCPKVAICNVNQPYLLSTTTPTKELPMDEHRRIKEIVEKDTTNRLQRHRDKITEIELAQEWIDLSGDPQNLHYFLKEMMDYLQARREITDLQARLAQLLNSDKEHEFAQEKDLSEIPSLRAKEKHLLKCLPKYCNDPEEFEYQIKALLCKYQKPQYIDPILDLINKLTK